MRRPSHHRLLAASFAASFVAAGLAVSVAAAEEAALELKRIEAVNGPRFDNAYRAGNPQYFSMQINPDGKMRVYGGRGGDQSGLFTATVKKEPKYASPRPFRAVATLGSQQYAFALDFDDPKGGDAKTDAIVYNRLYFDINRNGDLTDDNVIEGKVTSQNKSGEWSSAQMEFPRVDLTIDVQGTSLEYAFALTSYSNVSKDNGHVSVQLGAAAYRDGNITLAGKKRHVVLLDYNSNGCFSDETTINTGRRSTSGVEMAFPNYGDMLLVDSESNQTAMFSPFEVQVGKGRSYVSKLVNIDGKFYALKVSPTGDHLTLTPSSVATGAVTNAAEKFQACLYGDQAVLNIEGKKNTPIVVPEGEWRLLSYTIIMPDASNQEEAETQDKAKPPAEKSFLGSMAKVASAVMGSGPVRNNPFSGTYVYAQGRAHSEAIKVRKGETTVLSFGPPYNPVVTAYLMGTRPAGRQFPDQMELEMSLIGAAGEVCSNVTHFGNETGGASHRRLPRPHFTIKDPKGKVVHEGDFDENGGAQYRHVWQLAADPAEEYRVSIAMKADLVAINQNYESVLKTAQLQNFGNRNAPAVAAPQGPNRLLVGLSCSGVIVLLAGVLYLKRRFRAA